MEKKLFSLDEIKDLSEKTHKGTIFKKLKVNYDSKNFFVRIPKEIAEYVKLKKGDYFWVEFDTTKSKEEVILNCKLIRT